MRTRSLIALAGAGLLVLAGCSAVDVPPATPSASSAPDGDDASGCLTGEWRLDTDDLADQLESLVAAVGGSDVTVDGSQESTFGQQGELSMRADLTAGATIDGSPVTRSLSAAGAGNWQWVDSAQTIRISDWTWDEPGDADALGEPDAQLPLFDPSAAGDITVHCSADELSLEAAGSPVTARFER